MIGSKHWKWTIIALAGRDKTNRQLFLACCDCGTQKIGKKDYFVSGISKQCRNCFNIRKKIFNIGDQIHNWTLVEERPNAWAERSYLCKCKCGNEKIVRQRDLTRNKSTKCVSCHISEKNRTHDHSKSPTYKIWAAMKDRCTNKNGKNFRYYGGRGITYSPRWEQFENFLADMGPKEPGMTLDRIDPDGNYEPRNVRWATTKENHENRRNSKKHAAEYIYAKRDKLCKECLVILKGY